MGKTPVTIELKVIDGNSQAFKKLNAQLAETEQKARSLSQTKFAKDFGGALAKTGAAISVGVTAPLALLGREALRTSANYEQAMNDLGARTEASTSDLAAMGAEARRLGLSTTFGATQAVTAMTALGKAGFSTNDIIAGTGAVLNLAASEAMGMEEAANLVSDTINQFGLKSSDATRVVDSLAKAAGLSSISIQDLQNTLKYSAKPAKDFGVSLETLGAAVATLGNLGIKGEMAGTAMRSFFNTITGDKEKIALLQKAGLKGSDVFTDRSLKTLKPLQQVLGSLAKLKLTDIQRTDIFGKEFSGTIKSLIDGTGLIQKNLEEIGNAAGFAGSVGEARTKGYNGEVLRLKNAFEDLYIEIMSGEGGPLQTLTGLVSNVRDAVVWFKDLDPSVRNVTLGFAGIVAVGAPLLAGLGAVLTLLPSLAAGYTLLAGGIGAAASAFGALTLAAAPWLAIGAGVVALGYAGYKTYQNWGMLKDAFARNWNNRNGGGGLVSDSVMGSSVTSPLSFGQPAGFTPQQSFAPSIERAAGEKNEIILNFRNAPAGLTATPAPGNTSDFTVNTGRAMGGAL